MANKTALLVIDMSKDFYCKPYEIEEGNFKNPGLPVMHAYRIVKPTRELLDKAREKGSFIAYVLDRHEKDDPEFKNWPPHCIKHFAGSNVIDELVVDGARTYGKQAYNGFSNPYLAKDLKDAGILTVVLVGLVGDICVKETAKGAVENGFKVVIVDEGICFLPDVEGDWDKRQEKLDELMLLSTAVKVIHLGQALGMLGG